jgi:hypothetical protein
MPPLISNFVGVAGASARAWSTSRALGGTSAGDSFIACVSLPGSVDQPSP